MTLTFIQGYIRLRKKIVSIFSQFKISIWMKFSMLPQPVGLLELNKVYFAQVIFKGENVLT